jgi:beta-glucanase (GH16 family)
MKILYLSFLSLLLYVKVDAQTPVDLGYATLIWQDEFNYYNPNNWIIVNNGDHNGDPQLYKSGNVTFSNGKMNLLLKNEQTAFSQLDPSQIDSYACGTYNSLLYNYSSGWVETTNWRAFANGYIEARMKLPANFHASGGFWTWRDDDFPFFNEAEVDIVEMTIDPISTYTTTKFSTNIHTNMSGDFPSYDERNLYMEVSPTNFNFSDWHTYGLEKSPNRLVWYVDHVPVRVLYNHNMLDEERIIFNLMIRGSSSLPSTINESIQVDYFKSYSVNYGCQNDGLVCNSLFPLNTYFYTLLIGNNNCFNNIPVGTNYSFNAQEFIQINNNFNCPVGTELLFQTGMCH